MVQAAREFGAECARRRWRLVYGGSRKGLMAAVAGAALAGGGGKIKWEDGRKHDALLAEAKATGKPLVLYFTGEG